MNGFLPYLACEASAGSGKTWQLSLRYAALLLIDDTPAERILCLTFTNKAAAEMLERIGELLEHLGDENHSQQRKILCEWLAIDENKLLEKLPKVRDGFLRSHHRILTIDAFFNQILRQFALHSGLSPLFEITTLSEHETLIAFLREADAKGLLNELIALCLDQRRPIESFFEEFERLYASEAEIERFRFESVNPGDLKTAESAALEAFARIASVIESCELASDRARGLVKAKNLREIIEKTWLDRENLADYSLFKKCYQPEMDAAFDDLKSALKTWFKLGERAALSRMAALYTCFEESQTALKKQARKLDFNDVTHLVYRLLTQGVDGDFFYFRLDGRIEHLLIDEFQDTSSVQFEILRPLIEEFTAGLGTPARTMIKTFFYVGDAKQSIYRFRGGNPHLFKAVQRLYSNIQTQTLDTNYRSLIEPIGFVNRVFAEKIEGFVPQKPSRKEPGYVRVTSGEEPLKIAVESVGELLNAHVPAEKIALLTFTNDDGQSVADALLEAYPDLAVTTETTQKLINQPAVRAIIEGIKHLYFDDPLCAANFETLRGLFPFSQEKGDCPPSCGDLNDLKSLLDASPLDLAVAITERFGLYESGGGDLLRFLEWTAGLESVEALIFGYEALNLTAGAGSRHGVTILTVHKSKGLEFDHVIVVDRLGKRFNGGAKLIFDYDGVELKSLAWRFKNRESVDGDYRELLERQQQERERDHLNTLYVALTRGRDSLFIARKTAGSDFEALGLEDDSRGLFPQSRLPEGGQSPFSGEKGNSPRARPLGRQKEVLKTALEGEMDRSALRFGLALHHALETLGGFDAATLPLAIEAARNRYGRDIAVDDLQSRIAPLLTLPAFRNLIDKGVFLKEAPLIWEGEVTRLDLLIDAGDEWIVIDYKSGGASPDHAEQVRRYLTLLKAATGRGGSGYIAYLGHNTRLIKVEMT